MYKLFRSFVFILKPESAHKLIFFLLKNPLFRYFLKIFYGSQKYDIIINKRGLKFNNIVGLAAGMDKDSEVVKGMSLLGFGFIEVGTVTPKAQPGNPQPRLKRLISDRALLNRMGFNNNGVKAMKQKLISIRNSNSKLAQIGVNIGKNKNTPIEDSYLDYIYSFTALYELADYFVINVSSPNTPNLRKLQESRFLERILKELQEINKIKAGNKALFVKIAPDLNENQIEEIIKLAEKYNLTGIVATNTTVSRENLSEGSLKIAKEFGKGGLSGLPLRKRSTEVIKFIRSKNKELFIIGVGGIFNCDDMKEKLEAGADAIQIYTSFIYEGPGIVRRLKRCYYNKLKK